MKAIKMLGLAALTALTAMALVGASSAMAESTALCATDPGTGAHEVCPSGYLFSHVHERTLLGNPVILLSFLEVKCQVLFLGDVTTANNLGNPLEILGHFTYTECKRENGKTCEVTETSTHAIIKVLKLGHELADVTYEYEVHWKCGIAIDCFYDGVGLSGHGLGPLLTGDAEDGTGEPNGEVRLEKQVPKKTKGAFCLPTAELDILTTPWLDTAEEQLALAMGESLSGPTYITQ